MRDARVLVVGASSGIGRAFATSALAGGARVVVAGRRADALATIEGAHAVAADVCDPSGRSSIVAGSRDVLGGIDVLLWAAGRADLATLADTTEDAWRSTFATNVEAFNLLLVEALPLLAPPAIVGVLASETMTVPRKGLVAYAASKAALATAVRGWQVEQPGLRFSVIEIGATQPTEFGSSFPLDTVVPLLDEWAKRGVVQREYMHTDEVGALLAAVVGAALAAPTVGIEHLVLRSPSDVA